MIHTSILELQELGIERQRQFMREAAEARQDRMLKGERTSRFSLNFGRMLIRMGERLQAQNAPVRLPGQA